MRLGTGVKVALLIVGQICVTVANADAMGQYDTEPKKASASEVVYLGMDEYYDLVKTKILTEEAPSSLDYELTERENELLKAENEALRNKVAELEEKIAHQTAKIEASDDFEEKIGLSIGLGFSNALEADFGADYMITEKLGARFGLSYNIENGVGASLALRIEPF